MKKTSSACVIDVICWILLGSTLIIALANIFGCLCIGKNNDFFCINYQQTITVIIAIIIAFWANQLRNDIRKKKEIIEKIIKKLQEFVTDEKFYVFDCNYTQDELRIIVNRNSRKLSNLMSSIEEFSEEFDYRDEANYIKNEIGNYKDLIGNHINDINHLCNSKSDLQKYSDNIDNKCDAIIIKLYK